MLLFSYRITKLLTTVRVELRERHPDFKINQSDVIVDVLGGYKGLGEKLTTVLRKTATIRSRVLASCKRLSCCMLLEKLNVW